MPRNESVQSGLSSLGENTDNGSMVRTENVDLADVSSAAMAQIKVKNMRRVKGGA